jgi:hypothetical protein
MGDDDVHHLMEALDEHDHEAPPLDVSETLEGLVEQSPERPVISSHAWLASPSPLPQPASWRDVTSTQQGPSPARRSQWERIVLTPDIELNIRRPLAREDGRRVERMIEAALAIILDRDGTGK